MRRIFSWGCLVAYLLLHVGSPGYAFAQSDEDVSGEDAEVGAEEATDDEGTSLRAPQLEPIDIGPDPAESDEPVEPAVGEPTGSAAIVPGPTDAEDRLAQAEPDGEEDDWTSHVAFDLSGYFRVRTELQNGFFLGRKIVTEGTGPDPFSRFRPVDAYTAATGGCGDKADASDPKGCDTKALGFGNMRLRLEPSFRVSDFVSVHTQIDVFDNLVLGTHAAESYVAGGSLPTAGDSELSLGDAIVVKRAWGVISNPDLGELRFGRMGAHWGLGLLQNGGDGLDDDASTEVDRIMAVAHFVGLYFTAAYDFAGEGLMGTSPEGVAYDIAQNDEVDQFTFSVSRQLGELEEKELLESGGVALNGGAYFSYRNQLLTGTGSAEEPVFVRRDYTTYVPDLWGQLKWGDFRLEVEAAMVYGTLQNSQTDASVFSDEDLTLLQFGAALESELTLLDGDLHLYLNAGLATGDGDSEGLSTDSNTFNQGDSRDDTASTFRFNPAYRVDLILWRSIMGAVGGAFYLKPGVAYDFSRSGFGRLLQARVDMIYSRAMEGKQTWGDDPNLGLEIDASVTYRSEDGPGMLDGFYAVGQWGILFPFDGLGYAAGDKPTGFTDLSTAYTLRLLLGVRW